MKLISKKTNDYSEFLKKIRDYLKLGNFSFSRKNRFSESLDILSELNEEDKQQFLMNSFYELDKLINSAYSDYCRNPFHLNDPLCCMIELIGTRFEKIKKFDAETMALLSFYVWNFSDEAIEVSEDVIFNEVIIDKVKNKIPKKIDDQALIFSYLVKELQCEEYKDQDLEKSSLKILTELSQEDMEEIKKIAEESFTDFFNRIKF